MTSAYRSPLHGRTLIRNLNRTFPMPRLLSFCNRFVAGCACVMAFFWALTPVSVRALGTVVAWTDEIQQDIFSGPQPGEPLTQFPVTGVLGESAGSNIDFVMNSKDGPLLLVFVHERTRPAFGLTNTLLRFAATRKTEGLTTGVVFLTADPTETETWLKRVSQYFPASASVGISPDGLEGPGAYGLNRNVAVSGQRRQSYLQFCVDSAQHRSRRTKDSEGRGGCHRRRSRPGNLSLHWPGTHGSRWSTDARDWPPRQWKSIAAAGSQFATVAGQADQQAGDRRAG